MVRQLGAKRLKERGLMVPGGKSFVLRRCRLRGSKRRRRWFFEVRNGFSGMRETPSPDIGLQPYPSVRANTGRTGMESHSVTQIPALIGTRGYPTKYPRILNASETWRTSQQTPPRRDRSQGCPRRMAAPGVLSRYNHPRIQSRSRRIRGIAENPITRGASEYIV